MSRAAIDINCDLGEGTGNDAAIMPYISSANIACGYHAGNAHTMLEVVQLAKKNNVSIGAHPSYYDPEHFGRRTMHLTKNELYALVIYQMGALAAICLAEQTTLRHIKPHGALYNQAAADRNIAEAIISAIKATDPTLILYGLSGSPFLSLAKSAGLQIAPEVFADRTYTPEGTLTSRSMPHALITDAATVTQQVLGFVLNNTVKTTDNTSINMEVATVCIHGDGLHAPAFAKAIHQALVANHITIQPLP